MDYITHLSPIGFEVMDMELSKKKGMISNFIYSCSHGIRSPLKTIEGLVKLMKDYSEAGGEDWNNYLEMLSDSADRMQTTLEHFQQLSLNNSRPIESKQTDLASFASNLLHRFQSQMSELGVETHVHVNQKGNFSCDNWRVERILCALVSNALLFRDIEKVKPQIAIFITASASSCSVQVHDNGIGILQNQLPKIFSLFYRGSTQSTGVGMGLFVVRQMIEKLKGTISVQSTYQKGSVFSVWLPNQDPH